MSWLIVFIVSSFLVNASEEVLDKKLKMVAFGEFKCEGKHPANYTFNGFGTYDINCNPQSFVYEPEDYLFSSSSNGNRVANKVTLKVLAVALYLSPEEMLNPYKDGPPLPTDLPLYQVDVLYLATTGDLEGKFILGRELGVRTSLFKRCSSVLGYSYAPTKYQVLMIADNLNVGIFINPAGAFETFKRTATSFCQGQTSIML